MNFQRRKHQEDLEINFIPLIDLLLVIIIFLIVSAKFTQTNELQINLPTAEANEPQEKPNIIAVEVDANGRYMVNGQEVTGADVDGIAKALKKAGGENKEPTIIINADAKATHQSVVNIMEAARIANYVHITFATQAKAGA